MKLRRFNARGIQMFRDAISACRADPQADLPSGLLNDPDFSDEVQPAIEIQPQFFRTKRHAAIYFQRSLEPIPKQSLLEDSGLWSWLSCYYFDLVCPKSNGTRKVRNDYTYIFEAGNARNFYRHLLFISWWILDVAPQNNRLFLSNSISSLDRIINEIFNRLYLIRIPCIFEVLDRLYWDDERKRPRKGIFSTSNIVAGDLSHRFPTRIRQLEKNYDLHSLSADQLIELLGEEFRSVSE